MRLVIVVLAVVAAVVLGCNRPSLQPRQSRCRAWVRNLLVIVARVINYY